MQNINQLENDLWPAADQLRANSKWTATEYSLPFRDGRFPSPSRLKRAKQTKVKIYFTEEQLA